MKLTTKFSEGQKVWTLNLLEMMPTEREVLGVRFQSIKGEVSILYAFKKDKGKDDSFLWLYQSSCFGTKEELLKNLKK